MAVLARCIFRGSALRRTVFSRRLVAPPPKAREADERTTSREDERAKAEVPASPSSVMVQVELPEAEAGALRLPPAREEQHDAM